MHDMKMTKAELLAKLKAYKVKTAQAHYDGSGDSGEVEEVTFLDDAGADVPNVPKELNEAVDAMACNYLNEKGIDWYNNDGGYGDFYIDVDDAKVRLDHEEREMTSTSSSEEDDLADVLEDPDVASNAKPSHVAPDIVAVAICTCKSLLNGHENGCPYIKSRS